MSKKLVFKSTGPSEDFNRPSEVIAYASRQVREEMEKTFKLFREASKDVNERKHSKQTKNSEKT